MGAKVSYETANNSVSIDKKVEKVSRKGARARRREKEKITANIFAV